MEIVGKVIAVVPIKKGTSAKGNEWSVFEFVIETEGQYPKKALLQLWNEDIEKFGKMCDPKSGKVLKVSFDIDANEYNGRYYNKLKVWKIEENTETQNTAKVENNQPSKASVTDFAPPAKADSGNVQEQGNDGGDSQGENDLPF